MNKCSTAGHGGEKLCVCEWCVGKTQTISYSKVSERVDQHVVSRLGDVAGLGVLEPLAAKISLYAEFFHLLAQLVKLGDVVRVHQRVDARAGASGGTTVQAREASDKGCGQRRGASDDGSETNSSGCSSSTSSEDEDAQVLR